MGDDKDWQKQLMTAALMAATRTAVQYITNPNSRDETMSDVKSRLADVDYGAAAKAVSDVIDRVAEGAKAALNEAIDSIRENAEEAVEAAAEKAQEQLGVSKKRGKGRMFFGILLGIALGFVLLNEDRRNQLMDKVTGAGGPIDSSQWSTMASNAKSAATNVASTAADTASDAAETATDTVQAVAETAASATEEASNGSETKATGKKSKTVSEEAKNDA